MDPENNSTAGVVMIVAACMFIASFAGTWGPMAWVVIGESFALRTRAKQASLATAANWLGNCESPSRRPQRYQLTSVMISFLTPLANDGISYAFGFVFVGTNLAAALLVWFFLYETRMLSLENVDLMYSQPNLKAWTSHRWVPPGYTTRELRTRDANGAGAAGRRFSDDTLQVGANGEKGNGVKGVSSNEERRETV